MFYSDDTAAAGVPYAYEVVAVDSAGNLSAASNAVGVTPVAGGDPTDQGKFTSQDWDSAPPSDLVSASAGPSAVVSDSARTTSKTTAGSTPVASDSSNNTQPKDKWSRWGKRGGGWYWKWS